MENKEKKKDKKKIVILLLIIFAVVGIAGYGAYSYYWTQGDVNGVGDVIEIAAFNPQTTINESTSFLGEGGSIVIECPDSITGNESLTCTGSILVSNDGDTDITVEVLEATSDINDSATGFEVTVSDPSFNWTTRTITAGQSATLNISVPAEVSSDFGSDSSVYVSSEPPEIDGSVSVLVNFKLKATQVH